MQKNTSVEFEPKCIIDQIHKLCPWKHLFNYCELYAEFFIIKYLVVSIGMQSTQIPW